MRGRFLLACAGLALINGCADVAGRTRTGTRTIAGTATGSIRNAAGPTSTTSAGLDPTPSAGGPTSSTPGSLQLPQLGSIRFRCSARRGVQPIFDARGAPSEDQVTVHAGGLTRRNFTVRVVHLGHRLLGREVIYAPGDELTLPFGHYRSASFVVHQGTEARAIDARVQITFVADRFDRYGVDGLYACYVSRWSSRIDVGPF
jgi:hypothetical protein